MSDFYEPLRDFLTLIDELRAERDRYRKALEELTFYVREPHAQVSGDACGEDLCAVCLIEQTVKTALADPLQRTRPQEDSS